jgi:hypothetical protein
LLLACALVAVGGAAEAVQAHSLVGDAQAAAQANPPVEGAPAAAPPNPLVESAAAAAQVDPDAVTLLSNDDNGSADCGPDHLTWHNLGSFDLARPGSASLRATAPDGSLLFDLAEPLPPGQKLIPLWCGDLLGNGSQVLGYENFSGGAHCCFSVSIAPLQPGAAHLLDVDLGNGGLSQPQQLDGDGPLELVGASDVLAYFDDLSYAASPFLSLVFAYDPASQQYVEATREFPDHLEGEMAQASADLGEAVRRPVDQSIPERYRYEEQESVALRLYALHVLLGDADEALPALERQVAAPVAAWLVANAPAARAAMADVYDLGDTK